MERTLLEKKIENLGILREVVHCFFEILQNAAVPFATGSCRKFKAYVLGEWKLKHPRSLASELLKGEKKAIIFGCKRKTSLQVCEILLVNETDKRLFDTEQIVL